MKLILAIVPATLLCACAAPPQPVAFMNPTTGQVANCSSQNAGTPWPLSAPIAQREQAQVDQCAATYRAYGWAPR